MLNLSLCHTTITAVSSNSLMPIFMRLATLVAQIEKIFKVYLTTKPTYKNNVNEIDVSKQPFGTATLRLLLPKNDEVERACFPTVRSVENGFRVTG